MEDYQRPFAYYRISKKRLYHMRRQIARKNVKEVLKRHAVNGPLTRKQKEQILKDHAAWLRKCIKMDRRNGNFGFFDVELEMTLDALQWVQGRDQ